MHQNMFLTTVYKGLDSGGQEMHQNTFLTTPEVKKITFKDMILVVWKYAQIHLNNILTTPEVKK